MKITTHSKLSSLLVLSFFLARCSSGEFKGEILDGDAAASSEITSNEVVDSQIVKGSVDTDADSAIKPTVEMTGNEQNSIESEVDPGYGVSVPIMISGSFLTMECVSESDKSAQMYCNMNGTEESLENIGALEISITSPGSSEEEIISSAWTSQGFDIKLKRSLKEVTKDTVVEFSIFESSGNVIHTVKGEWTVADTESFIQKTIDWSKKFLFRTLASFVPESPGSTDGEIEKESDAVQNLDAKPKEPLPFGGVVTGTISISTEASILNPETTWKFSGIGLPSSQDVCQTSLSTGIQYDLRKKLVLSSLESTSIYELVEDLNFYDQTQYFKEVPISSNPPGCIYDALKARISEDWSIDCFLMVGEHATDGTRFFSFVGENTFIPIAGNHDWDKFQKSVELSVCPQNVDH